MIDLIKISSPNSAMTMWWPAAGQVMSDALQSDNENLKTWTLENQPRQNTLRMSRSNTIFSGSPQKGRFSDLSFGPHGRSADIIFPRKLGRSNLSMQLLLRSDQNIMSDLTRQLISTSYRQDAQPTHQKKILIDRRIDINHQIN